jgi:hypothetical protein
MKAQHQLTVKDLTSAVQNAKSESVNSLVIQLNGVDYSLASAAIVPKRNHSDLVLFAGASGQQTQGGFFASLFSKKEKTIPLNKQLHSAFFNALETVLISNGKNPNSFDFSTFQEIKSSIAQFSEALENYSNSTKKSNAKSKNNGFGGAL